MKVTVHQELSNYSVAFAFYLYELSLPILIETVSLFYDEKVEGEECLAPHVSSNCCFLN